MRFLLPEYPTKQGREGKTRLRKSEKSTVLLSPRSGLTNLCDVDSPSNETLLRTTFAIASYIHSSGASPDLEHRPHINPLTHSPSSPQHLSFIVMPAVFTPQFDNHFFKGQVPINTGLFIDGEWVEGSSGTFIEYVTPLR